MSRTRGHRKCARAKCAVCTGQRAVRKREINPRLVDLTLKEHEEMIDASRGRAEDS
jgi:hypothetical protein